MICRRMVWGAASVTWAYGRNVLWGAADGVVCVCFASCLAAPIIRHFFQYLQKASLEANMSRAKPFVALPLAIIYDNIVVIQPPATFIRT